MKKILWFASLLFALTFGGATLAQPAPSRPDADSPAAGASANTAPGGSESFDDDSKEVEGIPAQLDLLRFLGWGAIAMATLAGLGVYGYRHRMAMGNDSLYGLTTTVVVAPLLMSLAMLCVSNAANTCLGVHLPSGADATERTNTCRDAREKTANLVGAKAIWARVVAQQTTETGAVPIAPAAVKILLYLSVLLSSIILFFALKGAARKVISY